MYLLALRPYKPSEIIMRTQAASGYTGLQITLHWVIATLVILQLIFGESIGEVIEARERSAVPSSFDQIFADTHYWVGIAIPALMALRLWMSASQSTSPATQHRWMRHAAKLSHSMWCLP